MAGPGLRAGVGAAARESPVRRFWQYQAERFPLARYVPLVAAFTFSAASYSRAARGVSGFVSPGLLAAGAVTALLFFFLLRVLDEHKDGESDRRYRPELPVPRGLVKLSELRLLGFAAAAVALALNAAVEPRLLWACAAVAGWTFLMSREFFAGEWLRARIGVYLVSHMLVMPMIDAYTTGLDWLAAGAEPPPALWLFLLLTFLNGTVLEIGRKIRAPEDEREGVPTYSAAWGASRATAVWIAVLAAAALLAGLCAAAVGITIGVAAGVLLAALAACAAPAARFLREPRADCAARMDLAGGLWTLGSYLLLGVGPHVRSLLPAG